ncbi:MAG: ABC transporter permease subunit [Acidobacteria bacterium]|nr:ABC transporter permease subunit [Acidobacteriota bacterium]
MNYDWDFSVLADPAYLTTLAAGAVTTLELTGWCVVLGTPLGVGLGIISLAGSGPATDGHFGHSGTPSILFSPLRFALLAVRAGTLLLIDLIRAIPLLLLILTSYYVLPVLAQSAAVRTIFAAVGTSAPAISGVQSVIVAMSVNLAAFVADLVRASATSVSRGSILAARALGMSSALTWRRIVLPEVFREILPGLTLLYITMLKMTTLASTVAVYEVLHSADSIIQQTYKTLELYVAVCGLFVAIVVPLSVLARKLERTQLFRRRS